MLWARLLKTKLGSMFADNGIQLYMPGVTSIEKSSEKTRKRESIRLRKETRRLDAMTVDKETRNAASILIQAALEKWRAGEFVDEDEFHGALLNANEPTPYCATVRARCSVRISARGCPTAATSCTRVTLRTRSSCCGFSRARSSNQAPPHLRSRRLRTRRRARVSERTSASQMPNRRQTRAMAPHPPLRCRPPPMFHLLALTPRPRRLTHHAKTLVVELATNLRLPTHRAARWHKGIRSPAL